MPGREQPADAGFWLRVGAFLIDEGVLGLPSIVLISLAVWLNACGAPWWVVAGGLGLAVIGHFAYFLVMTWRRGQTVGKMAADIQVVTTEGAIPSGPRVFWRTSCQAIPTLVGGEIGGLLGLADVLWVACSKRERALHDFAAGTFVVRLGRGPCRGFVPLTVAAYAVPLTVGFLVIRPSVIQSVSIPSGSMSPTLLVGDCLLANRLTPRLRPMRVGELIVFRAPETADPGATEKRLRFVQRVVGVPGDRLRVSGGVL